MRLLVGVFFVILSFIGTFYFERYNGTVIPFPTLWYIGFILLGFIGAWFIVSFFQRIKHTTERIANVQTDLIKKNAQRIQLEFDRCEFKSGTFTHQIEDPNLTSIKLFVPGTIGPISSTITETISQSYLIYTDNFDGEVRTFISHSFPMDVTTLRFHVLQGNIILYVNRVDSMKYLFEFMKT